MILAKKSATFGSYSRNSGRSRKRNRSRREGLKRGIGQGLVGGFHIARKPVRISTAIVDISRERGSKPRRAAIKCPVIGPGPAEKASAMVLMRFGTPVSPIPISRKAPSKERNKESVRSWAISGAGGFIRLRWRRTSAECRASTSKRPSKLSSMPYSVKSTDRGPPPRSRHEAGRSGHDWQSAGIAGKPWCFHRKAAALPGVR